MKSILLPVLSALILVSCQTLPAITPSTLPAESESAVCFEPFLKKSYRFIHSIEFGLTGNAQGQVIGVTVVDPVNRFVSCVIMTVEGLVLFDAEARPALKINRAVSPFDSGDFAAGMIDDIRLIFFAPQGNLETKGVLTTGEDICRWRETAGDWIDVVTRRREEVDITRYSVCGNWKRRVRLQHAGNIYRTIELTARETFNYSLKMVLIEAEPLGGELTGARNRSGEE